jgi:hypothetical protein
MKPAPSVFFVNLTAATPATALVAAMSRTTLTPIPSYWDALSLLARRRATGILAALETE